MKEMVRYGLTLSLICIMAGASLAAVNSATKAKIIAQAKIEEETSLKEVMPQADRFESSAASDGSSYYKAFDKAGKFIGIVFKASAKGYSSVIETMVGMTGKGRIAAIKVLSQNETPGLGARVAESGFTDRFRNINVSDLKSVQAITGATISSKAVIDSVAQKAQDLRELLKK